MLIKEKNEWIKIRNITIDDVNMVHSDLNLWGHLQLDTSETALMARVEWPHKALAFSRPKKIFFKYVYIYNYIFKIFINFKILNFYYYVKSKGILFMKKE